MQNGSPADLWLDFDDLPLGSEVTPKFRIDRYRANCSSTAFAACSAAPDLFFADDFLGTFFRAFFTDAIALSKIQQALSGLSAGAASRGFYQRDAFLVGGLCGGSRFLLSFHFAAAHTLA